MKTELVKVILEKHTPMGNPGTEVEVTKAVAAQMTAWRDLFDGSRVIKFRTARLASEVVPEVPASLQTAAEMAAAGKKNVVETPAGDILPPSLKAAVDAQDAAMADEITVEEADEMEAEIDEVEADEEKPAKAKKKAGKKK